MLRADERTLLHLPAEKDAERIFALVDANRAHLRRWLPWVDGVTDAGVIRAFLRGVLTRISDGAALELLIEHDGELAGLCGYRELDRTNRAGELGYWLREDFGGRGIMTSCCRALVHHGFESLGLHRVSLRAAVENRPSRAVAERLGFQLEGIQREGEWLYDHFVDLAVYARLRTDKAAPRA